MSSRQETAEQVEQRYNQLLEDWCKTNDTYFDDPDQDYIKTVAFQLGLSDFSFLNSTYKSRAWEILETPHCLDPNCTQPHDPVYQSVVLERLRNARSPTIG